MKMGAMLILKIRPEHRSFIQQQKVFFVASAAPKGRVNVSPKGMSTLRVLGDNDVAYLDCTGSGNETRAHLLVSEDKRLTFMFCAFEGDPVILRLYGHGQSILRGTPEYAALLPHFNEIPGARQIVRLAVDLVQTSCGMGVPLLRL
jgi:Pyridoxamine 5'-phosphate oxidase